MIEDFERCYRAVQSRDPRFDGWFFTAVTSTGIYCRPSCPARTPAAGNVRFYPSAAAAQQAGFRACKRCRPDALPGSPEWDLRADAVGRAMRLILDGVVDREGVGGLARRLGYSTRQTERILLLEMGAGPLALARAQRAHTARVLIEGTGLPMAQVAFAAGFSSVRQFNDTVQAVFAMTPSQMRSHARSKVEGTSTTLRVRLPFRQPLCPDNLFGHLIATAVPGVEEFRDGAYRRTVQLPHGPGVVALTPKPDHIACDLALSDLRDLATAISRCRRLLDLDADPAAVDELLSSDEVLAPLVAKSPGRRVPRTIDAEEMALRAVIGQQVSTAAARTQAARLVVAVGTPIADPGGGLRHLFPTPAQVLDADPECLGMPAARRRAVLGLAAALAEGVISMDPGCDRADTRARLTALPGLGPWTVETVAMRALGDPDAFLSGDLGIRRAAEFLGLPARPAALEARSEAWRPWRAYAAQYLWSVLDHPINRLPSPRSEAVAHRGGT